MQLLREHHRGQDREQAHLAVFDLVGELLAITLEKHDIEVLIDSQGFLQNQIGTIYDTSMIRTIVDCEELIEDERILKITLSGGVQKNRGLIDAFMLVFSIHWDQHFQEENENTREKIPGTNTLWLQFSRKAEQFTDTLFRVNLYRENINGEQSTLGHGEGFLIFDKDRVGCLH